MADTPIATIPSTIENSRIITGVTQEIYKRNPIRTIPNAKGVFSQVPLATAKYNRHMNNRSRNYETTMARMYLDSNNRNALMADVTDKYTKNLAAVLAASAATTAITGNTNDQLMLNETIAPGYFDFILQRVDHMYSEKVQIVETLSDNYVAFFFGSSAPVFTYSGYLMNTFEDDWTMNMYRLFTDLGRGTQLAKRGLLVGLKYDSIMVKGGMMDLRWALESTNETAVSFSFQLLVKKVQIWLGGLGTPSQTGNSWDASEDEAQSSSTQEKVDPVTSDSTAQTGPSGTTKEMSPEEAFARDYPPPPMPGDANGNGYVPVPTRSVEADGQDPNRNVIDQYAGTDPDAF